MATRLVGGLPAPPARPAAGPVDRVSFSAEGLARAAGSHASANVPNDGEPTDPERVHVALDRAPVDPRLGAYGGRPDANLDLAPALDLFG